MPRLNIPKEINLCPWGRKCHFGNRCRHGASGHHCYFDWNIGTCHKPAGVCKFFHRCEVIPFPFPSKQEMILPTHLPSKDAMTQTSVDNEHKLSKDNRPDKETSSIHIFSVLQKSVGDDGSLSPTLEPNWASVVKKIVETTRVNKPVIHCRKSTTAQYEDDYCVDDESIELDFYSE